MNHREQTSEEERVTTLALAIQQHCFDYFDGKLTPGEWWTLVVDAIQVERHERHEAHKAELKAMRAKAADQEVVAQCPKCNGNMQWADSVHNAIRCEACQYLMVSISAHNHVAKASEVQR